jgi:predicted transcriptional regulator
MALVIKGNNRKTNKGYNTHYDSIYYTLIYLSQYPVPLTKHRISTNRNVLFSLLSKQLIKQVVDKDFPIKSEYENIPHYVISMKGIEYIKRYEFLQQLLA